MLVAAAPAMSVVYATKPITVNGTYFPIGPPVYGVLRVAGESDNAFMDVSIPLKWVGGIKGTCINEMRWIILHHDTPKEMTLIPGVMTFTNAEVDGKKGTLTIRYFNVETAEEFGGVWRIISGTGELANLHGEGTISVLSFPVFAYTGQIHFDP